MILDATTTWRTLVRDVLADGAPTTQASPGAAWRGRTSTELIANRTVWPMTNPVVGCPGRRLGYRFLAAEAAWILAGDNCLATILPYAKNYVELSDDGIFLSGAYGPPFVEQLPYVVARLRDDPATRQAIMTLWRPRPGSWRDMPCTVSLQYLVRPQIKSIGQRDVVHCVATMRSSDLWTGIVYDVHAFSMMTATVLLYLRGRDPSFWNHVALGNLYLTAGSQHLYDVDRDAAVACAARDDRLFDLAPFDVDQFSSAADLTAHLWAVAERRGLYPGRTWLAEIMT